MAKSKNEIADPPLLPWMRFVLRVAGTYNVVAGICMICFYHEGYKFLGVAKPELVLPVQTVGVLVALFGIGYHWVANDPVTNRGMLVLGFWSKLLGPLMGLRFLVDGTLPWWFFFVLFFSDLIYLPFFHLIIRRLREVARRS